MARKLTGRCSCGFVRYELLKKPMWVQCCHCIDCQRSTGGAFVINAIIETRNIKVGRGKPVPVEVPRDDNVHDIYRCPKCQVAVWSDYGRRPNLRFVRVGTLDDPNAIKPNAHIFTRWKVTWVRLPADTPAFRDYYNTREMWPAASIRRLELALGKTIA